MDIITDLVVQYLWLSKSTKLANALWSPFGLIALAVLAAVAMASCLTYRG